MSFRALGLVEGSFAEQARESMARRSCVVGGAMGFDPETGQLFSETIVPVPRYSKLHWQFKTTGSLPAGPFVSPDGAPSLEMLAARTAAINSDQLTVELVETIPWRLAHKIWKQIEQFNLDSFKVWKVFATVCPPDCTFTSRIRLDAIRITPHPLDHYVAPVTSERLQWITLLTIGSKTFSTAELVRLSCMPNLGGLDLVAGPEDAPAALVNDQLIRAWSRSARAEGAFAMLRVLSLRGWKDVDDASLAYLDAFPRLIFFVTERTSVGSLRAAPDQVGHVQVGRVVAGPIEVGPVEVGPVQVGPVLVSQVAPIRPAQVIDGPAVPGWERVREPASYGPGDFGPEGRPGMLELYRSTDTPPLPRHGLLRDLVPKPLQRLELGFQHRFPKYTAIGIGRVRARTLPPRLLYRRLEPPEPSEPQEQEQERSERSDPPASARAGLRPSRKRPLGDMLADLAT